MMDGEQIMKETALTSEQREIAVKRQGDTKYWITVDQELMKDESQELLLKDCFGTSMSAHLQTSHEL